MSSLILVLLVGSDPVAETVLRAEILVFLLNFFFSLDSIFLATDPPDKSRAKIF